MSDDWQLSSALNSMINLLHYSAVVAKNSIKSVGDKCFAELVLEQ